MRRQDWPNSGLPEGWRISRLDDICEIARGGSPRPIKKFLTDDPDGINWIKISDATASSKYIYKTKEKIKRSGINRSRLVNPGDFLLSNSMSFGRPYIMKTEGCIHDGWLVLRDRSGEFDQDFLYHFLGSDAAYRQFDRLAAGSTVRNLNIDLVSGVNIPLPPLPEQRRIVAILDEVFEGIDRAIAHTEKNLAAARELFESYLNRVFTEKGEGWEERTLKDVCELRNGRAYKKVELLDQGKYPVLRVGNFFSNRHWYYSDLELDDTKYCDDGDLLYAWSASFGPRIWAGGKVIYHYHIWRVDYDEALAQRDFLYYWFHWDAERIKTEQGAGTTMIHVSKRSMEARRIDLPNVDSQRAIAGRLARYETALEDLTSLYTRKLASLSELKQSILRKAFSGELTQPDLPGREDLVGLSW